MRFRWLSCLAMTVASCATAPRQPPADVDWRLVELDGAPVVGSAGVGGGDPYVRLDADSARVTGFTTCNRFFGRYDAPGGGRLRFGQLGSTKMACVEPARAQQEQRFMAALQSVDRYAVTGDTLILFENDRPRARFVAGQRR